MEFWLGGRARRVWAIPIERQGHRPPRLVPWRAAPSQAGFCGPYDAEVVEDYTGLTPPRGFDGMAISAAIQMGIKTMERIRVAFLHHRAVAVPIWSQSSLTGVSARTQGGLRPARFRSVSRHSAGARVAVPAPVAERAGDHGEPPRRSRLRADARFPEEPKHAGWAGSRVPFLRLRPIDQGAIWPPCDATKGQSPVRDPWGPVGTAVVAWPIRRETKKRSTN